MKKNPKVSFVIRTLNEEKFIGKVLEYVYQQTYKNFEVIIIDSGSMDKTVEIVKKYPVKLVQIKPEEFGYSSTLNLGIKKAKGDHIVIISGHSLPVSDTWLEDGLKNFKDKKIAGVTGVCITAFPIGYYSRSLANKLFLKRLKRYNKPNTPWMTNTNSIIRKDLWKKYPFDETLSECEDYDWAKEMISLGYKIKKDEKFSVYHSHLLLGRPGYLRRWLRWRKIVKEINNKKRPTKKAF